MEPKSASRQAARGLRHARTRVPRLAARSASSGPSDPDPLPGYRDGPLDLLVSPAGSPPYEALRRGADAIEIDGVEVRVASIDDLIAMKRAGGRPQDLADIEALEVARRRLGRRRG